MAIPFGVRRGFVLVWITFFFKPSWASFDFQNFLSFSDETL